MILYTQKNCPKCNILKQKLDEKGLKYDICEDVDLMIRRGFTETPMLELETEIEKVVKNDEIEDDYIAENSVEVLNFIKAIEYVNQN